jgi:hypothetical protein
MSGELPDELLTLSGCDVASRGSGDLPGDSEQVHDGELPATR